MNKSEIARKLVKSISDLDEIKNLHNYATVNSTVREIFEIPANEDILYLLDPRPELHPDGKTWRHNVIIWNLLNCEIEIKFLETGPLRLPDVKIKPLQKISIFGLSEKNTITETAWKYKVIIK
jgi:hypothetical protein